MDYVIAATLNTFIYSKTRKLSTDIALLKEMVILFAPNPCRLDTVKNYSKIKLNITLCNESLLMGLE
jgi:hypothetical protein